MGIFVVKGMGMNGTMTIVPRGASLTAMRLSERVRWAIDRSGKSMREVSLAAGLSEKYVQKLIERDARRPDGASLAAIARVVDVSSSWLITGEGSAEVGIAPLSPPETRLEREPAPRVPAADETALETKVFDVAAHANVDEPGHYTLSDLDATRAAVRETGRWIRPDADLAAMARQWLDAARQLRLEGERATPLAIATRVAVGKLPTAQQAAADRTAALNALAAEAARAHGFEPGSGAAALTEALRARGLIPKEEVPAPPPAAPPAEPGARPKRGGKG